MRGASEATHELTGEALRIALERETGWPGNLLAQLIDDEIQHAAGMRRAHEAGLTFSAGERVAEADVVSWLGIFTDQAMRITNSLKVLVEQLLTDAFNTKDVGALAAGAKQIGDAYRACLEWAARLRCASHL